MAAHIRWTVSIEELPPELLVHIFHLVRDASLHDSLNNRPNRAFDLDWIKVSFVSHRWRQLAIGAPSLWAHIDLTMPHVAAEMLRRSQTAPLHLHTCCHLVPSSPEARKPIWPIARPHISRAKELDLRDVDSTELELFTQNVDGPAPMLESILIHSPQLCSLTPFLKMKMPSLRVLNLKNIIIPRPLPTFPQLITLRLRSHRDGLLTALEILTSLELMPMLENVELFRAVLPMAPAPASSSLAQHKPVNLPKLKSFTINTANLDALYIVNAISYPTEAAIRIICGKSHLTETSIEAAVNICSRLRNHPFPVSAASIHYRTFAINLETETVYNTVPLCLRLIQVTSSGPLGILLRRLCKVLPWKSIEKVTTDFAAWPESWAEVVALWSGVRVVEAHSQDPYLQSCFLEGLHDGIPNFATLDLWEGGIEHSIPSLLDMLHHRQACGLPVPRLLYEEEEVSIDELITRTIPP